MNSHLLIVEDNADFVANLSEILSDLGHEVRTASSCKAALGQAAGWVQVALVDLRLPDGDGTRLAEQLKELEPDCEVVLLTGHASVKSGIEGMQGGAFDYCLKPIDVLELLEKVELAAQKALLNKVGGKG